MLVKAVLMCRNGVRLSKEALRLTQPIQGVLIVEDWCRGHAENRALRVARLKHPKESFCPELVQPLFDPVLVRCDQRGMVLTGFECNSTLDGVARTLQLWWLRTSSPLSG